MNLTPLTHLIKKQAEEITLRNIADYELSWDDDLQNKLPILIAHVSALWTLLNSKNYVKNTDENRKYLLQLHPSQVVTLFRMFGIGYSTGFRKQIIKMVTVNSNDGVSLRNNLIEVQTGEGKSIILAVVSVVLALLGFNAYCVCYSQYLSRRDYQNFFELFSTLNMAEHIFYDTFSKICEDSINERFDIRHTVNEYLLTDKLEFKKNRANSLRPRILLIDEVDVFFSSDFYGSYYSPLLILKEKTITDLIKHVWASRNQSTSFMQLTMSEPYKKCIARFAKLKTVLDEDLKKMLVDLASVGKHQYEVTNDQICYTNQNDLSYHVYHGYKTMFAYFRENELNKANISDESLDDNIGLNIDLGAYSYADMPKKNFLSILGVTGTLSSLNASQQKIIRDVYKIKDTTYMPSIYGEKRLYTKDVILVQEQLHFARIVDEIRQIREANPKRAIFVCFESVEQLDAFYASPEFAFKASTSKLTVKANDWERKQIVHRATKPGMITLFTSVFGRGTDFVVYDEKVNADGGVHVIQTFLSREIAEEIQIKGRTARQGKLGTYRLIISSESLSEFNISLFYIERNNKSADDLYSFLDTKRRQQFEASYCKDLENIGSIKTKSKLSYDFLDSVYEKDYEKVDKMLFKK